MRFLLYNVHDFEGHYNSLSSVQCDRETIDMVIDASAQLCINELEPLNAGADTEGARLVEGIDGYNAVKTSPGFQGAYDLYRESGWQGLSFPEEFGGQGLPMSLSLVQAEMIAAANYTFLMFPGLSKGCIQTILSHAEESLKAKYLPPLVAAEYTGTMCLTEPQCGSDLGQVTTKATPNDDGSYDISGTKIFISCGDHDLTPNIIHCVLARLPGAPAGTKGISLFLVPKRLVTDDGEVGDMNSVNVSRIENKMGCHGSPTCQIEFDGSKGWLIGTANRGLNHMFTFINTSRVGTAVQGVAAAELSFQHTLWYAKDRRSMRALSGAKDPSHAADPIIYHPSVASMLLIQKAVAEGGRSMVYECAQIADRMVDCEAAGDAKGAHAHDERLAFLTPILKGFLTEMGKEAADVGMQAYGGHGYIKDNKVEQVYRDVRIASMWEGTTQIQALDLLGRKVMLQKLKPIHEHCGSLFAQCKPLLFSGHSSLRRHAWSLLGHALEWQIMTYQIAARAASNKEYISSTSVDYLMFGGYVTLASHWLRMEVAAVEALAKGGNETDDFYLAKVQTSAFVFDRMLPRTRGHKASMLAPVSSISGLHPDHFSFDQ
jgi:alkylation response protein AidB-like acyl-CoA dehydrogenase